MVSREGWQDRVRDGKCSNWFKIAINPKKLPRTTTRAQWREIYRWLRLCERKVVELLAE